MMWYCLLNSIGCSKIYSGTKESYKLHHASGESQRLHGCICSFNVIILRGSGWVFNSVKKL